MEPGRLHFLGTGTAFHTDGRGSQALLFERGEAPWFLVDMGPTVACALGRHEIAADRIDRVFVTHLHGDHTAGWPFLLLNLRFVEGRERPVDVHGPPGLQACLEGLARLCYGDLLAPGALPFEVRYHEIPVAPAEGLGSADLRFDVRPMDHHPTSIGYRFDLAGARVAVSGDTRWCPGLEELARGVRALVVECTSPEPVDHAHLSLEEIRAGVARLGAERILLTHLTDEVATRLAADPVPRVEAAHDGMIVDLGP